MNSNIENTGLKKLKEAFREINQWEYENLHLDTLEEVIPSARYKKRIERLIKRQKQPYWRYVNTVGKRVAILVVAIALIFALPMGVSAVREPVVEFFVNVCEKFVEFFYDENDVARAPDTIETVYTLGYVPEGYELESCEIGNVATRLVWKNENEHTIIFSQRTLEGYRLMDNESEFFHIVSVNNVEVAFTNKLGLSTFVWNSDQYAYTLHISDNVSLAESSNILNSIIEYVS